MNSRRCFCVAALLSLSVHYVVFGTIALAFLWPRPTPPQLILVYGDSDREGLPVEVVALDPGVFRQADARTAGGDHAPKSTTPEPAAVESPPAVKPPESKPKPTSVEKPVPSVEPTPEPPTVKAGEPKIVQAPPSTSTKPPATTASPVTGPGLPGAPGGARLPLGTPSSGGTVGSPQGVRLVGKGKPTYPPAAREAGQEGIVYVRLRISADGEVLDAWIFKSSGHRLLDRAALSWAREQQYRPARQGNDAVEAEVTHPVKFYLY